MFALSFCVVPWVDTATTPIWQLCQARRCELELSNIIPADCIVLFTVCCSSGSNGLGSMWGFSISSARSSLKACPWYFEGGCQSGKVLVHRTIPAVAPTSIGDHCHQPSARFPLHWVCELAGPTNPHHTLCHCSTYWFPACWVGVYCFVIMHSSACIF